MHVLLAPHKGLDRDQAREGSRQQAAGWQTAADKTCRAKDESRAAEGDKASLVRVHTVIWGSSSSAVAVAVAVACRCEWIGQNKCAAKTQHVISLPRACVWAAHVHVCVLPGLCLLSSPPYPIPPLHSTARVQLSKKNNAILLHFLPARSFVSKSPLAQIFVCHRKKHSTSSPLSLSLSLSLSVSLSLTCSVSFLHTMLR